MALVEEGQSRSSLFFDGAFKQQGHGQIGRLKGLQPNLKQSQVRSELFSGFSSSALSSKRRNSTSHMLPTFKQDTQKSSCDQNEVASRVRVDFPRKTSCLNCEARKLNCYGGQPNSASCFKCCKKNLKCEWDGKDPVQHESGDLKGTVTKKSSRELKEKFAEDICELKRLLVPLATTSNRDDAARIANEVSANGFDRVSRVEAVRRLSIASASTRASSPVADGQREADRVISESLRSASRRGSINVPQPSGTVKKKTKWDLFRPTISRLRNGNDQHPVVEPRKESVSGYNPFGFFNPPEAAKSPPSSLPETAFLWSKPVPDEAPESIKHVSRSFASSVASQIHNAADQAVSEPASSYQSTYSGESDESSEYDESLPSTVSSAEDLKRGPISELTVTAMKQSFVDRLMKEFFSNYANREGIKTRPESGSSGTNSSTRNSSSASASQATSGDSSVGGNNSQDSTTRKGDRDGWGEDRREDGRRGQPSSTIALTSECHSPKFACPFYKRDPQREQKSRACKGSGFTSISRVKEHLYRIHKLPPQCERCYMPFQSTEARAEHLRAQELCEMRGQPLDVPEGFNERQEKQLKSKKRNQGLNNEDKWREVYRILFPDDDESDIPYPYVEDTVTDLDEARGFEQYYRRELPRLMRTMIENFFEAKMGQIEPEARLEIAKMVQQAVPQIQQSYLASRNGISKKACEVQEASNVEVVSPLTDKPSLTSAANNPSTTDSTTSVNIPMRVETPTSPTLHVRHEDSSPVLQQQQTSRPSESWYQEQSHENTVSIANSSNYQVRQNPFCGRQVQSFQPVPNPWASQPLLTSNSMDYQVDVPMSVDYTPPTVNSRSFTPQRTPPTRVPRAQGKFPMNRVRGQKWWEARNQTTCDQNQSQTPNFSDPNFDWDGFFNGSKMDG